MSIAILSVLILGWLKIFLFFCTEILCTEVCTCRWEGGCRVSLYPGRCSPLWWRWCCTSHPGVGWAARRAWTAVPAASGSCTDPRSPSSCPAAPSESLPPWQSRKKAKITFKSFLQEPSVFMYGSKLQQTWGLAWALCWQNVSWTPQRPKQENKNQESGVWRKASQRLVITWDDRRNAWATFGKKYRVHKVEFWMPCVQKQGVREKTWQNEEFIWTSCEEFTADFGSTVEHCHTVWESSYLTKHTTHWKSLREILFHKRPRFSFPFAQYVMNAFSKYMNIYTFLALCSCLFVGDLLPKHEGRINFNCARLVCEHCGRLWEVFCRGKEMTWSGTCVWGSPVRGLMNCTVCACVNSHVSHEANGYRPLQYNMRDS